MTLILNINETYIVHIDRVKYITDYDRDIRLRNDAIDQFELLDGLKVSLQYLVFANLLSISASFF